MKILCFGLNHESAPISLLEKVSLSGEQTYDFISRVREEKAIREFATLSTCNRTEFYLVTADPQAAINQVLRALEAIRHESISAELHGYTYSLRDDKAASHLFRVASGVNSLIVGEAQILGQLKKAFEIGMNTGSVGATLNTLLQRAISFGRRVRTETNIGRGNVSVASIAHRIAERELGSLTDKTLLVMGSGETAQIAGRQFVDGGIGDLYVLNRTAEHARAMAEELGGRWLTVDRLETGLELADIIVCAVGAPHHVITRGGLETVLARRSDRPVLLIDLSMPRNIDPSCAQIPGVTLYALENLEAIAAENRAQREGEIAKVELLIQEETSNFVNWTRTGGTSRLIRTLRRKSEAVRQRQLDRFCRRMTAEQREEIVQFTDSLMRAVMHDLTKNIKGIDLESDEGRKQFEVALRLFNISPDSLEE